MILGSGYLLGAEIAETVFPLLGPETTFFIALDCAGASRFLSLPCGFDPVTGDSCCYNSSPPPDSIDIPMAKNRWISPSDDLSVLSQTPAIDVSPQPPEGECF